MGYYYKLFFFLMILGFVGCKSASIPVVVEDDDDEKQTEQQTQPEEVPQILPIQKKYAKILDISPEKIKNITLYKFIDSWMDTPYKMGGENKKGIDCSFFSQFLYHDVYDRLIERTAEKQFIAPSTDKFVGQQYLREGDLLFFNLQGSEHFPITHVGVYLGHGYFVHSTARKSETSGRNGVQISNFKDRHWQRLFVAAGRKPKQKKGVTQ